MSSREGCAVWITGLPASGKSTVSRELAARLRERGLPVVVLESDEMRTILTPAPSYSDQERDIFYRQLVQIGQVIAQNGTNVIFDATANKRAYREQARALIKRFAEIYVQCPVSVCMARDPKGIYASARSGTSGTVPGVQSVYEPPLHPELTVDGQSPPAHAASLILEKLHLILFI